MSDPLVGGYAEGLWDQLWNAMGSAPEQARNKTGDHIIKAYNHLLKRSKSTVELKEQVGIFKSTRKVHKEPRGAAKYFSHLTSVLKNPKCLHNSTMHKEQVFYFCYKLMCSNLWRKPHEL